MKLALILSCLLHALLFVNYIAFKPISLKPECDSESIAQLNVQAKPKFPSLQITLRSSSIGQIDSDPNEEMMDFIAEVNFEQLVEEAEQCSDVHLE